MLLLHPADPVLVGSKKKNCMFAAVLSNPANLVAKLQAKPRVAKKVKGKRWRLL